MKLMKKLSSLAAIAVAAIGLSACSPGYNVPGATFAGATAGGITGGLLSSGSFYGVAAGALIGGIIGNQVGQSMDRRDIANMEGAIVNTPINQEATWINRRTSTTYIVRPVRSYHNHGRRCRRYRTTVIIKGRRRVAYGRACRQRNGRWRIVR